MTNPKTKLPPLRANKLLQPTLFDRLFDENPQVKSEKINQFVVNKEELKHIIQRDIAYLFNSINKANEIDKEAYPEVYKSTLNYGIPAFLGQFNVSFSWDKIKKKLLEAVYQFEPRIIKDSVEIYPNENENQIVKYNTLSFSITGKIYSLPYPLEFIIQSMADLENSYLQIKSIKVK